MNPEVNYTLLDNLAKCGAGKELIDAGSEDWQSHTAMSYRRPIMVGTLFIDSPRRRSVEASHERSSIPTAMNE